MIHITTVFVSARWTEAVISVTGTITPMCVGSTTVVMGTTTGFITLAVIGAKFFEAPEIPTIGIIAAVSIRAPGPCASKGEG